MLKIHISRLTNSRLACFCRNYLWSERRLWIKTLGAAVLVAGVVYVSKPREYEAVVFTFAESTVPELNDTRSVDAMTYGIRRPVRDDILPSYYKLLFRSRPFLMSVLQSPVVRQKTPGDTITLYDYVTQDIRYPWWTHLRSGVIKAAGWPVRWVRGLGRSSSAAAPDEGMPAATDIGRYGTSFTGLSRLTRGENAATAVLWKRIACKVDVRTRGVTFRVRMQDPLVAAIAADSLRKRVEERVNESRMAKIRRNMSYLQAEAEKARKEYEQAQQAYAVYRDRNQNLSTRHARLELSNLNTDRQLAYNVYRQRVAQVNKAKENLYRKQPVLTVIRPAEVPPHAVAPWPLLCKCLLAAVAGTWGWIFLRRHAFRFRFRKRNVFRVRRPQWWGGRLTL